MSASSLSRQQQRRLKRPCAEVDRLIDTDRRFFERRPDRSYRVRKSFRAEIDVNATLGDAEDRLPEGHTWLTAVRQIRPGARLRGFFHAGSGLEADFFSETVCRRLYAETAAASPQARQIERALAGETRP